MLQARNTNEIGVLPLVFYLCVDDVQKHVHADFWTCLFSCIFSNFYENVYCFWTHNYFCPLIIFFLANYLLHKPRKLETKLSISGWVIEISLGSCFLFVHSAYSICGNINNANKLLLTYHHRIFFHVCPNCLYQCFAVDALQTISKNTTVWAQFSYSRSIYRTPCIHPYP